MEHIQGPDFPTGGAIYNINEIKTAYATGGAKLSCGDARNRRHRPGKSAIIISELPYQVNKALLVAKIADLVHEKNWKAYQTSATNPTAGASEYTSNSSATPGPNKFSIIYTNTPPFKPHSRSTR